MSQRPVFRKNYELNPNSIITMEESFTFNSNHVFKFYEESFVGSDVFFRNQTKMLDKSEVLLRCS